MAWFAIWIQEHFDQGSQVPRPAEYLKRVRLVCMGRGLDSTYGSSAEHHEDHDDEEVEGKRRVLRPPGGEEYDRNGSPKISLSHSVGKLPGSTNKGMVRLYRIVRTPEVNKTFIRSKP